jgi:hypothetical protein
MDERVEVGANMARYAFLASLVLTILRRMKLAETGETQLRPFSADDRARLLLLRKMLIGSCQGAKVAGIIATEPDMLLADGDHIPLEDKLEMYSFVKNLLPSNETFEGFVPEAGATLERLAVTGRLGINRQKQFIDDKLVTFLENLRRGSDLVVTEHSSSGTHHTLA